MGVWTLAWRREFLYLCNQDTGSCKDAWCGERPICLNVRLARDVSGMVMLAASMPA